MVVVGSLGVGKTCLVHTLVYETQLDSLSTISPLCYRLGDYTIWDTPGDDRYSWACEPLLKRADLILYCVSLEDCDGESLKFAPRLSEYKKHTQNVLLVYTKADLESCRPKAAEIQQLTNSRQETLTAVVSAVTGLGIEDLKIKLNSLLTKTSQTKSNSKELKNRQPVLKNNKDNSNKKCLL